MIATIKNSSLAYGILLILKNETDTIIPFFFFIKDEKTEAERVNKACKLQSRESN